MAKAGADWRDVESIAVGIGPGTFTGLRIGVATARALGQALAVGLRPVSSLEALAAGVADRHESAEGRPLVSVIDARRGQIFAAVHRSPERSERSSSTAGAGVLEVVHPPDVMEPAALL
jgi:tRNA threonylcarbamoyladenosine biosynthesis protein TsaB